MKKVFKFLWALTVFAAVFASAFAAGRTVAHAEGGVTVKLHYNRTDGDYSAWSVWFWEAGKDGADYAFADENGDKVATVEVTAGTMSVGFIVRTQAWDKDINEDQFIDISEMISGTVHVYVESGVEGYTKVYGDDAVCGTRVKSVKYDGDKKITVTMTGEIEGDLNGVFAVAGRNGSIPVGECAYEGNFIYTLEVAGEMDVFKSYSLTYEELEYQITMPNIYSTEEFEQEYTYTGSDLGAVWSEAATTFRVWAPTADEVAVKLYETGDARVDNLTDTVPMTKDVNGTWTVTVQGNLNGTYYTYRVTIDGVSSEATDPYARTTGVNGDRAMVIDLDSTDPEGWDEDTNPHAGESITDAIIYEGHVRDLTTEKNTGIEHPGKYLGVIESGRTSGGVSTGLAHLQDLGITHLHLLPVYDFGSVNEFSTISNNYNWGYDPQNYNVPEGSYSTDATDGSVRVKEFKQMVKGLHDAGISVVMDVVYNHVYNAGEFCFNVLVPGYFSRIADDGTYSNGSGCGNDTATERSMVRKYIVDSVCYWADEYHIDGFRFDLVGLIDTVTINEIMTEVHKTHPDVIFYGEGWEMSTNVTKSGVTLATMYNADQVPGFSFFNDVIRDGLKGSVFNTGTGFVSGQEGVTDKIAACFIGQASWCNSPSQTINYASCHDNNTLIDRLTLSREDASEAELIKMNNLAASIYMLAEGTPFMQAGEEMLRSKTNADGTFNSNSYASGDSVNTIMYSSLEDKTTAAVYDYYKGLIAFRKEHGALRLSDSDDIYRYVSEADVTGDNMFGYLIEGGMEGESAEEILLYFNAGEDDVTVTLPDGEWNVCINDKSAGVYSLDKVSGKATVKGISALVLVKGDVAGAKSGVNGGLIAALAGAGAVVIAAVTLLAKKKKK